MVHSERDPPVVIMKRSDCVRSIPQREPKHPVGHIRSSSSKVLCLDDTPLR